MNHIDLERRLLTGAGIDEDLRRLMTDDEIVLAKHQGLPQIRATESSPIDEGKRQITFVASDETPDRVGDIIKVNGWNLRTYKQNPVVLWGHDTSGVPPIGRATNVRRGLKKDGKPALLSTIEFAPEEAHPFAETVYQLAKRGFLNAVSVGFMPKATKEIDEKEKARLGMPPYGVLYSSADLLEISVVSVPANPSALVTSTKSLIQEGVLQERMAQRFLETVPQSAEHAAELMRARVRSFVDFGALTSTKAAPDALRVGDMVRWNSSGGSASGKIERIERDGTINIPNSSFKVEGTAEDPAALIRLYRDGEPTDTRVGHKFSTLTKLPQKTMTDDETPAEQKAGDKPKMPKQMAAAIQHLGAAMGALEDMAKGYMGDKEDDEKKETTLTPDPEEEEEDEKGRKKAFDHLGDLIDSQAEQARAMSTLVDSISDLTKRLPVLGGYNAGAAAPDGVTPAPKAEVTEKELADRVASATNDFLKRLTGGR